MEHFIETIGRNMFAIFGVMALGGAAFMVASRSAVHSVLGFLFAMLCVAGCFLSMEAEFLGMEGLGQNMFEPSPVGKFSVAED